MESNRLGDHRWETYGLATHDRSITSHVVGVRIGVAGGLVHLLGTPVLGTRAIPYALVIAAVCIAGPAALWAVPAGTVAADILIGTPFRWSVITGLEVVALALLVTVLWRRIRLRGVRRTLVVLPLAVSVGLVSVGLAIATGSVSGFRTATAVYPWLLLERAVLVPALATLVVLVWPGSRWNPATHPTRSKPISVVGVIGSGWIVVGTVIGVVRRDLAVFSSIEAFLIDPLPAGAAIAMAVFLGSSWIATGLPFLAVVCLLGWYLHVPSSWATTRRGES